MQAALRPPAHALSNLVAVLTSSEQEEQKQEEGEVTIGDTYTHNCVACYLAAVATAVPSEDLGVLQVSVLVNAGECVSECRWVW